MEIICSMIAFTLIILGIFAHFDDEDFAGPIFFVGCIFLIPLIIYYVNLSEVKIWSVKKIEIISSEEKINKITLAKDPGSVFFDKEHFIYTTKCLNIGDVISDNIVVGESIKEIEVK